MGDAEKGEAEGHVDRRTWKEYKERMRRKRGSEKMSPEYIQRD